MNLGKLGAALLRELGRNKKKTALLAIVAAVAVYFWGPLLYGWFAGEADAPAVAGSKEPAPPGVVPPPAPAAPRPESATNASLAIAPAQLDWNDLASALQGDLRMASVSSESIERDPFDAADAIGGQSVDAQAAAASEAPIDPAELGLQLTATIVGPRSSRARIGGKSYRLGDEVVVAPDADDATTYSFTLDAIGADRVVLGAADGSQFELSLARTELVKEDRIVGVRTP